MLFRTSYRIGICIQSLCLGVATPWWLRESEYVWHPEHPSNHLC